MNMLMPVVSMARLMPFHEATIEYFCRAVSGSRESGAEGGGGSLTLLSTSFLLSPLLASFPNSQPMMKRFLALFSLHLWILFWLRNFSRSALNIFPTFYMRSVKINLMRHFSRATHTRVFVFWLPIIRPRQLERLALYHHYLSVRF